MPEKDSWARNLGLFGIILSNLLGTTGAGVLIGYLGWKKLGLTAWFFFAMTTAGLVLAMYRLYLISKKDWNA